MGWKWTSKSATCCLGVAVALVLGACGGGGSSADGGTDAGPRDGSPVDGGGGDSSPSDAATDTLPAPFDASPVPALPTGRGLDWVHENPMFLSALTVSMGAPSASFASAYLDDFNATAVHLWQDGVPTEMDGWRTQRPGVPFVVWLRDDGTSLDGREVLGGYGPGVAGRIGYQVGDEPRTLLDYDFLEEGMRAVRAADPDALVILNFSFLAEGLDEILDRYCASGLGDVISYDRYTRSLDAYGTLGIFRDAGLRCGMPYWRYVQSFVTGDDIQTVSDMRWDGLVGLLYGYTGHSWFLYQIPDGRSLTATLFETTGDAASARTERFAFAATVNSEMQVLGRTITKVVSSDVRYVPALASPPGIEDWVPGVGGDPHLVSIEAVDGEPNQDLLVAFFADAAGEIYVMLQNPNHTNGDFPTQSERAATARLTFDFRAAGGVADDRLEVLDHRTDQVLALVLGDAGGGRKRADVVLEPGNVLLFKYATGAPFAGQ